MSRLSQALITRFKRDRAVVVARFELVAGHQDVRMLVGEKERERERERGREEEERERDYKRKDKSVRERKRKREIEREKERERLRERERVGESKICPSR